jgi:hypothetical protein
MNIDQGILKKRVYPLEPVVIYDFALPNHPDAAAIAAGNKIVFNSVHDVPSHLAGGSNILNISAEAMPGILVGQQDNVLNSILAQENKGSFLGEDIIYVPNTKSLKNWTVFFDAEINFTGDKQKAVPLMTNKEKVDDAGWAIFIDGGGFLSYEYNNTNGEKIGHTLQVSLPEKSFMAASKGDDLMSLYVYDTVTGKIKGEKSFAIDEPPSARNWTIGGPEKHFESLLSFDPYTWNCYRCLDQYQNFLNCLWAPSADHLNPLGLALGTTPDQWALSNCQASSGDLNASVEPDLSGACCADLNPYESAGGTTTTAAGTTTTTAAPNFEYERFSGDMNHIMIFDSYMNGQTALGVFESFLLTEYTPEQIKDVATPFQKPGEYVETKVRDGVEIDRYEYVKEQIGDADIYNKVPVYKPKYKTVNQFINAEGFMTKMIPTLIPESKIKDNTYAASYHSDKCISLDYTTDTAEYVEIYSCDESFGNTSKKAVFQPGDSTFKLDKVYDENEIQVYLNGPSGKQGLLELGVDYEVVGGQKIKKLQTSFVEIDELIYDIYEASKLYLDFFGYSGNVYMFGMNGQDVYLDGKKLIKDINYEDTVINGYNYLMIHSAGLSAGRLGIVGRYNNINIDKTLYFMGKYLHCISYGIVEEITWVGGKRVVKENGYELTHSGNLNNSEYAAPQKTTLIYSNEQENFS